MWRLTQFTNGNFDITQLHNHEMDDDKTGYNSVEDGDVVIYCKHPKDALPVLQQNSQLHNEIEFRFP